MNNKKLQPPAEIIVVERGVFTISETSSVVVAIVRTEIHSAIETRNIPSISLGPGTINVTGRMQPMIANAETRRVAILSFDTKI